MSKHKVLCYFIAYNSSQIGFVHWLSLPFILKGRRPVWKYTKPIVVEHSCHL